METPEINLTKAVDTVARELYATQALTTSGRDEAATEYFRKRWDCDELAANEKYYFKRLALAALTPETVADIARQAWDACLQRVEDSEDYTGTVNPWAQDWDEALKDL